MGHLLAAGCTLVLCCLGCSANPTVTGLPHSATGEAASGATPAAAHVERVVPFDRPFRLGFGRQVRVEHTATRARFAKLLEDSRCPSGAQCIQAGRVRVRLVVSRGDAGPVDVELATDPDRGLASGGGVTWELQAVEPPAVADRDRRPRDYVLTLNARPLRER